MDLKKIFLLPVIISIIGHVVLISVSSMIDLRSHVKAAELFMVNIAQPQPAEEPKKEEEKPKTENEPQKTEEVKQVPSAGREDTVDIGSSDIKYADYLAGVKKKITQRWVSSSVYRKNEKGEVSILMTLNADGSLSHVSITVPSGIPEVDQGTVEVIHSAAPFRPLPRQYDLSRLHITASFLYGATQ